MLIEEMKRYDNDRIADFFNSMQTFVHGMLENQLKV